jgi:hypothetical protein
VRRESATHGAGKTRVTLLKRSQSVPVPMMLPSVSDNRSRGDNLACMIPTLSHRGSEGSARYISVETCSDVVNGKFEAAFDNTLVIDCRFPFEYEAGHIKVSLAFVSPVRPALPSCGGSRSNTWWSLGRELSTRGPTR